MGSVDRRRLSLVSAVAFLALLLAIPFAVLAQTTSTTFVTGSITTKDPLTLSDGAVAVVTIVDRSARGDGVIVGLQRKIDLGGTTPVTFKVRYDPGRIDPDHAYVAFAAIIDGAKRWQNTDGVPVITGGPTSGVDIRVKKVGDTPPATIDGELTKKDKTALSGKAVALAAVLDVDTGRTISWTAITPSGDVPIAFSLGFDPSTVDADATLVGWGAIVDKGSVWEADGGSPIIAAGSNLSTGSILVIPTTPLPVAPSPTPQPTPVTIPAVKNQPEAQAKQTLQDADLVVGTTNKAFNQNVKKGNAIKTKPEAGTKVAPQTSVTLVVSKGPSPSPSPTPTPKPTAKPTPTPKPTAKPTPTPTPKPTPTPVTVPDVRNETEADAVISITDVGLKVGQRLRRFNDKVATGDAIKTDPAKGTKVKPGTAIDLYISKGPSPSPSPTPSPTAKPTPTPSPTAVVVPKTKGMTEADAVVEMTDAGLRIGDRIRRSNADIPAGAVIKSDPAGGTSVPSGTRVDLYISTGPAATPTPKPVTVPDVRGMAEADAIIALTDADLEIGQRFRQLDPDVPADAVIDTDPGPKSKVTPGTFVDLFVSNGPAPTPVPTPSPTPSPSPSPEPSGSPIPWPYPSEGPGFLSGALVYRDQAEPGPFRQVVITLLEESGAGSRVVPTTQYVAEGSAPLGFALSFDWAQIRPDASYRVLAAIVDGEHSWFSDQGAAAITGGAPINGLLVPLFLRGDILEGQVSGVIVGVDQDLSADAVREAFLIRSDTGEVIAFDTAPASTATRAQAFAVPFLLTDIDQTAEYVVVARVIDGPRIWTGPGVPVVTNGNPFRVVVQVSAVTGTQPMLDTPGS